MKPRLYQYAACPFCSKIATLLRYKGVDYDTVEVHPLKKKEIAFSTGYRAVPIYLDSSGQQVNDSTPIMRHIDKEFPDRPVFGSDPEAEDRWLTWSEDYVQGLPTVIYGTLGDSLQAFDYVTRVGKFGWFDRRMIRWSGALIMTMVAGKIRRRRGIGDPKSFLRDKVREWARGLGGRPFMGGDRPNAADIAVFGISRVVAGLAAGQLPGAEAGFWRWSERTAEAARLDPAAVY